MHDVLLMGAGKIGEMISDFLAHSGSYRVVVADSNAENLAEMPKHENISTIELDVTDDAALDAAMEGKFAVLSALPYNLTPNVARSAARKSVNYFDLTEDVASTRIVKELAADADVAFVPQCGLAPGFISIVAHDLAESFDRLHNLHLRVGALPQFPSNALSYNLTWSTDGVINEYCEPCEAIVHGKPVEVPALGGVEQFSLDGVKYEAFNTSGGLGTLCETYEGEVDNLDYRTIRYPGHRDAMKMLIHDLKLGQRREVLKDVLEHAIPATMQDVIVIFVTASGWKNERLLQESYANKVYAREINGVLRSGIQITTAAGICAMVDLLAEGKIPQKGFVRQEDVNLNDFLENRFGRYYVQPKDLDE